MAIDKSQLGELISVEKEGCKMLCFGIAYIVVMVTLISVASLLNASLLYGVSLVIFVLSMLILLPLIFINGRRREYQFYTKGFIRTYHIMGIIPRRRVVRYTDPYKITIVIRRFNSGRWYRFDVQLIWNTTPVHNDGPMLSYEYKNGRILSKNKIEYKAAHALYRHFTKYVNGVEADYDEQHALQSATILNDMV